MSRFEEHLGEIVVKTVFGLFKERPWAAYLVVAGIYILALSILLTQVQDPSTKTFIAFALGFILFVAAREFNRGVRQSGARLSLESSSGLEVEPLPEADAPASDLFAESPVEAPARAAPAWLLPALVSAMAAGASAALLLFLFSFTLLPLIPPEHEAIQTSAFLSAFVFILACPAAFVLGGAVGTVGARRALYRDPEGSLNGRAALWGASMGLGLGVLAAGVDYALLCDLPGFCL